MKLQSCNSDYKITKWYYDLNRVLLIFHNKRHYDLKKSKIRPTVTWYHECDYQQRTCVYRILHNRPMSYSYQGYTFCLSESETVNIRFLGYRIKNSIRSRLGHCSLTHCVPSLYLKHITIKRFLQRYEIPNLSLSGSRRQFRGKLISVPCQLDATQHYDNKIRTSLPVIQGYYKY